MRKIEHNRTVGKENREIQKLKCLLAVATESISKKLKKFLIIAAQNKCFKVKPKQRRKKTIANLEESDKL